MNVQQIAAAVTAGRASAVETVRDRYGISLCQNSGCQPMLVLSKPFAGG
jgi:hypothetical protein